MIFTFDNWHNWDVVKCETDAFELIVGISAGPRILSVRYKDSENLLYQDTTDFGVGDWRMYGGHRFTVAPETAASYYPDNDRCNVSMTDTQLMITTIERPSGIRLSLMISEAAEGDGFDIQHMLENNGIADWEGALWAITCVPRSAQVWAACTTPLIHCWPGTDPVNWQPANRQMSVKPGDFKGKAGWHSEHATLTALQQHGTLVIQSPDTSVPAACVDNGSNVEIFVCPGYIELETLSSHLIISPGTSARHLQQWKLYPSPINTVLHNNTA
ncbi:hypothetical protein [Chitinophaga sp. MM2321]|uniref:hypothetical protein n=1 Tax=Chitinophaga sp. MM2321 TaxID=3137178 RepID=UPI0032D59167